MVQDCYTSTIHLDPLLAPRATRLVGAVLGLDDLRRLLGGVALRLLAIDKVKTLGLDDAVDEGTREAGTVQTVSTEQCATDGGDTYRSSFASAWLAGLPLAETCFS